MPSLYEPCGLAQMIAMRYGCVPVARATGGLVDTIDDYSPNSHTATGFLCQGSSGIDFSKTIQTALKVFTESEIWQQIQLNGMLQDYSWQRSARKYYELYCSVI